MLIAQQLTVSLRVVLAAMLKTLRDAELVEYAPYEGVRLDARAVRNLRCEFFRRHRLIELFLAHTLKLSWDEVHEEAEHMEHAVSDRLVDRIDDYLGHPQTDPHGDPIPKSDGTVEAAIRQGFNRMACWEFISGLCEFSSSRASFCDF